MRIHYEESRIPDDSYYSVRYAQRSNDRLWHIPNHYSNTLEIVVYCSIDATLYLNNDANHLHGKSMLILPPYTVHSFDVPEGQHDYYIIHLLPEHLPESVLKHLIPDSPCLIDLSKKNFDFILGLLKYLTDDQILLDESAHMTLRGQSIDLFTNVCLNIADSIQSRDSNKKGANPLRFAPLLKYLDDNMLYAMSADHASEICSMSKSHFFSQFKDHFGKTFSDFLTERLISQAKYLLTRSEMTVTEIAQTLDFCDGSYFTKVFRASTGLTPRQFRKEH